MPIVSIVYWSQPISSAIRNRSSVSRLSIPGGSTIVPSAAGSSRPVHPRPKSVARKNPQMFTMSTIVTSMVDPSDIVTVSTRFPVGKVAPVKPPPWSRKSTRISAPVPGTPPIAVSPWTRASPFSTSRVMYIIFCVFVENARTVRRPSSTCPSMFFINAKTGTPAEMLPQFIL